MSKNEILLSTPETLTLPPTSVSASVAAAPRADGSIDVEVNTTATALFVTLTTLAAGRFTDNAFAAPPGQTTVQFVPVRGVPLNRELLVSSLRVEHLQANI